MLISEFLYILISELAPKIQYGSGSKRTGGSCFNILIVEHLQKLNLFCPTQLFLYTFQSLLLYFPILAEDPEGVFYHVISVCSSKTLTVSLQLSDSPPEV